MSKNFNRLVVVETVYHAPSEGQAIAVDSNFSRWLETDEQPYGPRNGVAKGDWQTIDFGWLGKCSMVIISNAEGKFTSNPTEEERAVVDTRIIEVACKGGEAFPWIILPGQSMRATPSDLKSILIRCKPPGDRARYIVTVFPS